MKSFKVACVLGRFQPFHNGHFALINRAFELAEHVVILIGSTEQPRTTRNPFTFEERSNMIRTALDQSISRYSILSIPDSSYDLPAWQERVQQAVSSIVPFANKETAIVGCNKDSTTYYLSLFPQWKHIDPSKEGIVDLEINATEVRKVLFSIAPAQEKFTIEELVPIQTANFLEDFVKTKEYKELQEEHQFLIKYQNAMRYRGAPYAPSMQTVDAVVIQGGHILLIKRGSYPGKGLGALPGGFVNPTEKLEDAVIRELIEETQIDVPEAILKSSIVTQRTFDDPHRDQRGRVYTQAFLIDLDNELKNRIKKWGTSKSGLAKVKGGDDAAKAKWIPIAELNPLKMYGDHYHVINKMLSFKK
jgi:bifunctional NMN adenylyltransferase/nudix hydrolase